MWAIVIGGDDMSVGVVSKELHQLDNYLGITASAWAYSSTGLRLSGAGGTGPYGPPFHTGDVVAVRLDMDKHELSFYLNGRPLGTAFTQMPHCKLSVAAGWRAGRAKLVPVETYP
eukprot:TRINITY_DN2096_c0_g1_i1.p1 TRINITY_DN2096_c0_g1~~TRINITY_DN2096_c0_g1_i1.p1  ORF type:complete len:115 (-),score=7.73 TRINITY_DN2096_c0_g1_i1:55-399(-)